MARYDLAVVGGGMLGLAHAWQAARAGMRAAVFERGKVADGATVRNFGMLAIVAQRPGAELSSARAALANWQEVAAGAGVSLRQAGCLFAARSAAEMTVLRDCAGGAGPDGHKLALLDADAAHALAPGLRREGLRGALHSLEAWKVDQRGAPAAITRWLAKAYGVTFHFGTEVIGIEDGVIETRTPEHEVGRHEAGHIALCGGDEFRTLYPQAWAQTGVETCRLQMLRTAPQPGGWRMEPFVLGGLSMTRYNVFADCPGLSDLRAEQQAQKGDAVAHGVHIIAAQEDDGSITVGDSHHYGPDAAPDDPAAVDAIILREMRELVDLPVTRVAQTWVGNYAHQAGGAPVILHPAPNVTAVTVTNGQGMTHGFTVAAQIIGEINDARAPVIN